MTFHITRTDEQIKKAIAQLRAEAEGLPPVSFFGDDNTESIEELKMYADQLESCLEKDTVPDNDEVLAWLHGEPSDLSDCFIDEDLI